MFQSPGFWIPAALFAVATLTCGPASEGARSAGPDYSLYNAALQDHVRAGEKNGIRLHLVDYAALGKDERWSQVVQQLAEFNPAVLESREEKLAFWINAYNIAALEIVAQNWPLKTINSLDTAATTVWKRKLATVGGKQYSLDEIEHEIIRSLGEPRIHFAVVCASLSCPDLRREAFVASRLDAQLEDQTKTFLNNSTKGLRVEAGKAIHATKLFEWFAEDFKADGGVEAFIREYRPDLPELPVRTDISYNWEVNG